MRIEPGAMRDFTGTPQQPNVLPDDLAGQCTVTVTERMLRPYWLVA